MNHSHTSHHEQKVSKVEKAPLTAKLIRNRTVTLMHSQLRAKHFSFSCFWVSCQSTALRSFVIRSFVVLPKRDLMFHVGDTACQRSAINVSD